MNSRLKRFLYAIGFSGMLASTITISIILLMIAFRNSVTLYEPNRLILYPEIFAAIYSVVFGFWLGFHDHHRKRKGII